MALLLVVGGVFVLPLTLPQETCDAFGSWMACPDGSPPRCANVPIPGARRNQKDLAIRCSGRPRSAAPIFVTAGAVAVVLAAISLTLVAKGLTPDRAGAALPRGPSPRGS